jgi:ABC-type spermidine/putrescine transport system permease subunit II
LLFCFFSFFLFHRPLVFLLLFSFSSSALSNYVFTDTTSSSSITAEDSEKFFIQEKEASKNN